MINKIMLISGFSAALLAMSGTSLAVDQDRDQLRQQDTLQTRDKDQIYGKDLMTNQERAEHRARMRAAKTAEERNRIRNEHHKRMKARAKARGINLPDEPPAWGKGKGGMGNGSKCGGGMGKESKCGGGMGGGKR